MKTQLDGCIMLLLNFRLLKGYSRWAHYGHGGVYMNNAEIKNTSLAAYKTLLQWATVKQQAATLTTKLLVQTGIRCIQLCQSVIKLFDA